MEWTPTSPDWNGSGYGSKTPGAGRPGADRVSRWDAQFPMKTADDSEV